MLDRLKQLQVEALSEVANTTDLKELNDLRVKYLGKKGPIQEVMKNMKDMAPEERKSAGQVSNEVKSVISQAIETKKAELEALAIQQQLANETIDVTLPGRTNYIGVVHQLALIGLNLKPRRHIWQSWMLGTKTHLQQKQTNKQL